MADDSRRSTAAQFFMEEEKANEDTTSTYDKVVSLLNEASLLHKDSQKTNILRQVQELIIHKDPNLLDNFLDEMLAFQSDKSIDVKKVVISFMEDACKHDYGLLHKTLPCLQILLQDENVNVQKKVILTLPSLYKIMVSWLIKSKTMTDDKTFVWETMKAMKKKMFDMIDSENDGVRTHAVKFMEGIILVLSRKTSDSEVPKNIKPESDVTIDSIPEDHTLLKAKRLEEEGKKMFDVLLQFQGSPHISSINLMTVMGSLTNIAKQRPTFFGKVVQSFETLQVNLPPTLAKSQVSSVRKNLKMHMLSLLKHSASHDYLTQITTLLTDLGATNSEVMKNMPKIDESRKRKAEDMSSKTKKARTYEVDLDDDDAGMTPFVDRSKSSIFSSTKQRQTAVDITAEDLVPRLNPQNVADLVLISMVMLPDQLPAHFQATYTPIAAAGTEGQIKHMARLLSNQLTAAGMGKGIAEIQQEPVGDDDGGASPEYQPSSPKQLIQTVVGGQLDKTNAIAPPAIKTVMQPPTVPTSRKGIQQFKLSRVTKQLDHDELQALSTSSLTRILNAEKNASQGNALPARTKLLTTIVAQFGGKLKTILQDYIFDDLKSRYDLAFSWLYQEYAISQGFCAPHLRREGDSMASYDDCLTRLLSVLLETSEFTYRENFFHRLLLEAPSITNNALKILKKFCLDVSRVSGGMKTLKALILSRPLHRLRYLEVMLQFCHNDVVEVRTAAIFHTKMLYENAQIKPYIEQYASRMLKDLLLPSPPEELVPPNPVVKTENPAEWSEETIKMCLYLYLGLLPSNHALIHPLSVVYTSAVAFIKRIILRALESPVKEMSMQSPELLTLVENCPKGAETLVTRVIHILTDKVAPSPELVERVRDLYHKRVPDVRFLIPVLTGLTKKEVIQALPKLLKLNPVVVKEVFNRLLGGHGDVTYTSPLTPVDLLIALHNIDPVKCDMKTIIKATNLCFSEKKIYTQEVLAVVMKSLMDQEPLPTLFMRTVLQSLSMYPRLIGFVLNVLQRLITKQVWKQKKVWEGFIRCCQKTKPQSFFVLLQLPAVHLKSVFDSCPDLREPLLAHVNSFTPHQRAHIPKTVLTILETDPGQRETPPSSTSQPDVQVIKTIQPMQTIQTVQTISTTLVKVKDEPPDSAEMALREAENRMMREHERKVEAARRKQSTGEAKRRKSASISTDVEMESRSDSPESSLAIAEEPMDTSFRHSDHNVSVKQVSKPVATRITTKLKTVDFTRKNILIPAAQWYHRADITIKMNLLKLGKPKKVDPLSEEAAVDLAGEMLNDALIFSIAAEQDAKLREMKREIYDLQSKNYSLTSRLKDTLVGQRPKTIEAGNLKVVVHPDAEESDEKSK
ncbi:hypothetical protein FSP39_021289 [Pinctada imbricata]|uniref:Symplekin n=1 Tax=Pinctada imbricata TaxID=66713 RepID=A0AA88XWP8_PINIB|nr:hypothetical protein FSP39_021289 [Pinctada imbricata]